MKLPEINLTQLHESIAAGFKKQFPDCNVDYYNRPGEKIITPAIFFELEEIETAGDSGTEQLEVNLNFSADVIVSFEKRGLLGVRLLALAVASFVQGNRWGERISPGVFKEATPESFSGTMDAYESWRVSWKHTALVGNNIWEEAGDIPKNVLVCFTPYIGISHKAHYFPIIPKKEVEI